MALADVRQDVGCRTVQVRIGSKVLDSIPDIAELILCDAYLLQAYGQDVRLSNEINVILSVFHSVLSCQYASLLGMGR